MRPSLLDPLFAALTVLPGTGPKLEKLYRRLFDRGEDTPARVVDLLFHLPSGTIDRRSRPKLRDVAPGTIVTVGVTVDQLSETQRRVLTALCRPYAGSVHLASPASNQQISEELFLSLDAVKANLRAMYQLFGVARLPQNQKRAQLAERAITWGLVGFDR